MRRRSSVLASLMIVGAIGSGVAGSATSATTTAPPPTGEPVTSIGAVDRDDGILRIGLLLPQRSEEGSWLGLPASSAARDAVNVVNQNGGFNGEDVELVSEDEGDDAEDASASIDRLINQGVDAVVGPASSNVALATLPQLMSAGILTCSPTATSLLLDDYPNRELFFRTVPSDSLQMAAVAQVAESSGLNSVVIFYSNDQFGQGLLDAATARIRQTDQTIAAAIALEATDTDFGDEALQLEDYADSAVVILANTDQGLRMLQAISSAMPSLSFRRPWFVINDAVRKDPAFNLSLDPELIANLRRLGPVAGPFSSSSSSSTAATASEPIASAPGASATTSSSEPSVETSVAEAPELPDGPFALNTYDCVNLIALAANEDGTDDPVAIAQQMPAVAAVGTSCVGYPACAEVSAQGLDIDYFGVNGQNPLYQFQDGTGDLDRAFVMQYEINEETGTEKSVGGVSVAAL